MNKIYNQNTVPGPEYRVRTTVRYILTRYCHPYSDVGDGNRMPIEVPGGSTVVGEFTNEQQAFEAAEALAARESHCEATVST
jgi:hypothetical protein